MKAVVMAGGEGSRLRPLTAYRPKPMVPVGNLPVMEHILGLLRRHSLTEIVVTLHYLGDDIRNHFGDGSDLGVKLDYSVEEVPLGTAGSVKLAEEKLRGEPFVIISGDALTDIDLTEAIQLHKERGAWVTIVLTHVENPLEYGIVVTDDRGRVTRFLEKPSWGEVFSDTINTGIYIVEPQVLQAIKPGVAVDWSQDVFPRLLAAGRPLYGHVASGYWCDIGNLTQYRQAHEHLLQGRVALEIPGRRIRDDIWVGRDCEIDKEAVLYGPIVVGNHVRVARGARIYPYTVLGNNTLVEEEATVQRSIVWSNGYIGRGATVSGAILAHQVTVGAGCTVGEGAVVGDRCVLRPGAHVSPQIKLWPNKVVEAGSRVTMSLIWGSTWQEALFRDGDVVGLTNLEITPEFAMRLVAAYGSTLERGAAVTTSRDDHPASRMILRSLICGFLSVGTNVLDLRSTPSAIARRSIPTLGAQGGVHVRVNPRDPRTTLIEFLDGRGINVSRSVERKIEGAFFREDFRRSHPSAVGRLDFPSRILESYTQAYFQFVDPERAAQRQLRLVLDHGYSRLASVVPVLLGRFGCDLVALHAYTDFERAPRSADDRERLLAGLGEAVSTLGADLGALLDDDGERLYLVDETGRVIRDDLLLALMASLSTSWRRTVGSAGTGPAPAAPAAPAATAAMAAGAATILAASPAAPGATAATAAAAADRAGSEFTVGVVVSAPTVVDTVVRAQGGAVLRTRQDARSLMNLAAAHGAGMILAGDTRGGFIFPAFQPTFDGLVALGKVLEALAGGARLSELVSAIPDFYVERRAVECPWEQKGRVMRLLAREASAAAEAEYIDGIKLFSEKGWVLALPDSAEPVFHLIAEGRSRKEASELILRYASRIRELQRKGA